MLPESVPVPQSVRRIVQTLADAGHDVWCVGGAVRDVVLGHASVDVDLATSATPDQVQGLFRRTVPIGVDHGTVAVLDADNTAHEITTFRRDVDTDGRHAVVEFGVSIEEDLARRDFTINAMAFHPIRRVWCDPFGGAKDLAEGVVRAVGDPVQRFREDRLRILRAIRFASRFEFEIESETWAAARSLVGSTRHLSAERVREEWWKGLMTARRVSGVVQAWADLGALPVWLPEITVGEDWSDRLAAVDRLRDPDPVLVTALLSADVTATLRRLKCSNAAIKRAEAISRFGASPPARDAESVRRWLSAVEPAGDDLLTLWRARGGDERLAEEVKRVQVSGAALSVGDLAIGGNQLKEIGVPEGPEIGRVLGQLMEAVLGDPEKNERAWLENRARELVRRGH